VLFSETARAALSALVSTEALTVATSGVRATVPVPETVISVGAAARTGLGANATNANAAQPAIHFCMPE
jgi:hypothetical protein